MRYQGQVAVVTGAGSGIGRAIALRLAAEGAHVVLFDRDAEAVGDASRTIDTLGQAGEAIVGDVSDAGDVSRLFDDVFARHAEVHVLANVAGISPAKKLNAEDVPEEDIERIFGVNLFGLYRCIQRVAPAMKKQGYGRIVNVASIGAIHATTPGNTVYAMSKGGVAALTRQLVLELSAHLASSARPCSSSGSREMSNP
jgi:NAD(P)-dependent dehydrogenase (short-subunit alcohol dehydrogenase family)